jgi:AAA+ superfamily predicted ATPase
MSSTGIHITKDHLREEIPVVRNTLINSNIIELLASIDSGGYGFTITGLRIVEIIETTISVLIETSKQLANLIQSNRGEGFAGLGQLSENDSRFINMFSLYTASVEALDRCMALMETPGDVEEQTASENPLLSLSKSRASLEGTFKLSEVLDIVNRETGSLQKVIAGDYVNYLKFYRGHSAADKKLDRIDKVLVCTLDYFRNWKNSIEKVASDSSYALYCRALETTRVSILEKSYEGFRYSAESFESDNQLMDVECEDVIGNEDYMRAAKKLALDVAGFDFSTWTNPKQINPVLFALGNPGCGKTVTAHAVGNFFLDFCKQHEIKARFVIIRRTDWASSYQNASANRLIEIFKRNIIDFRGVVGVYWPDIDTAFGARGESGLRDEEKNILGAVFGLFDGTILPKNGQWFMMSDANFMNMDKATISRITQDPYQVKGPEFPGDFVKLLRDVKLRKHGEYLKVSDEEWEKFGKTCLESGLSGRSIENMSRKVISMIEDFEYPVEYFKSDINKKKEIIRQYSKNLNYADIDKIVENYIKFEKEAEEKAAKKRYDDRVNEISTYLSAEKAARRALMGME